MIKKYSKFIFESMEDIEIIKDFVQEYLDTNWPKLRMDQFLSDTVSEYIDSDDLEGDSETYEDCYRRVSTGGAVEYDMIYEITKELCKELKIDEVEFFDNDLDDLVTNHMVAKTDWYDKYLFGPKKIDFNAGVKNLMASFDKYNKDDLDGIKF